MRRKRAGKTESDNIAAIDGQPEAIKVKKPAKKGKTGDLSLLLLTVVLVMFGTVMIFSASYYKSISCLLYTSPSPRDRQKSRMPSSA